MALFSRLKPLTSLLAPASSSLLARRGISGKNKFKELFPNKAAASEAVRTAKPKYMIDSYGQTTGLDYPEDAEKTSVNKMKREKRKSVIGATSLETVLNVLEQNEGIDINIITVQEDQYADKIVVVSGKDTKHLTSMTHALASSLMTSLTSDTIHVEGLGSYDWMVVDAGSVVVHLFLPQIRAEYNIEEMWVAKGASQA